MKYFGECQDAGDIEYVFGLYAADEPPTDNEVVFACIENRGFEGYAFVIYRRGGKLYEVNSSHCSCNGFTWGPEETTEAALAIRKFSFLSAAARAALRTLYPSPKGCDCVSEYDACEGCQPGYDAKWAAENARRAEASASVPLAKYTGIEAWIPEGAVIGRWPIVWLTKDELRKIYDA